MTNTKKPGLNVASLRRTKVKKSLKGLPILDAHLKEWQELSKPLMARFSTSPGVQEALRKSILPIIEAQKSFNKVLESTVTRREHLMTLIESVQIPLFAIPDLSRFAVKITQVQQSVEQILSPVFEQFLSPVFEQLQKTFVELPFRTREALSLLGAQGWYLDLKMSIPDVWQLKDALAEGNVEEAEDALIEYFESRLTEIEEFIIERFPERGNLVKAAFNAHGRAEYGLSIPVFLAQTDGICKEVVDQNFFMRENRRPRTAIYVDQIAADSYKAALLSPLSQTLPINASGKERPEGFSALNRHLVLHGESLDYGNKTNSLKAISLLNYVAHVLEEQENTP